MSGIATAIVGSAVIGGITASRSSSKAASASREAADVQAQAQREGLEYLKETERVPQHYREGALSQLGMLYGLGAPPTATAPTATIAPGMGRRFGGEDPRLTYEGIEGPLEGEVIPADPMSGKRGFVESLRMDPFYKELVGAGEEAVLRGASVTGGLRSGTASENLARVNQEVLRSIYGERVAGLQGLAGLPSYAPQIAGMTGEIGGTMAGGILGAGRARAAGTQGVGQAIQQGIGGLATYYGGI